MGVAFLMLDTTRRFALHLATHFPPTREKVERLFAECKTPAERAAVLVDASRWIAERIAVYHETWAGCFAHVSTQPHNPYVVAVYEHPPGRRGERFSYMIGTLQDVTCPHEYQWGLTKLGAFLCIEPVQPDTPVSWCRTMIMSNSLITKDSWAYEARRVLKEWLPKPLHKLVNKPRKYNHMTKADYAAQKYGPPDPNEKGRRWRKEEFPEYIRQHTKAELFIELILTPDEREAISAWIDVMDFYHAANGKVHPDAVEQLIKPEKRLRQGVMTALLDQVPEASRPAKAQVIPNPTALSDWEQMRLL
jgi:hypothetical protein